MFLIIWFVPNISASRSVFWIISLHILINLPNPKSDDLNFLIHKKIISNLFLTVRQQCGTGHNSEHVAKTTRPRPRSQRSRYRKPYIRGNLSNYLSYPIIPKTSQFVYRKVRLRERNLST